MIPPAHALPAFQVSMKSVTKDGHFTLQVELFFFRISRTIPVGSLSNTTRFPCTCATSIAS
jgi:hypothetical protein